jgi:hypothetical protein
MVIVDNVMRFTSAGLLHRSIVTTILTLSVICLAGCATTEKVTHDMSYQSQLGRVAIVATPQTPELRFEGFVHSKGAGAAAETGGAFVSCIGAMGGGSCSGSVCGGALLLMLGICGVAGLVGGVSGAVVAPSADQVTESETALIRAFEVRTIQDSLRSAVVDGALAAGAYVASPPEDAVQKAAASGDYRSFASYGVNTVLETTLTKAGTSGQGINDPSTAYIDVHVRIVDVTSNTERFAADYQYQGRRLDLAGWSANQAKPLIDELDRGYRTLGSQIAENVFQLYPFPDRSMHSAGKMLSSAFGLAPIYPPTRGTLTGDRFIGAVFEWYTVDSLRPQFKWEAFPRPSDIAVAPDEMARVSNVKYDLIIAKEENMVPGEVVYRAYGLTSPENTMNISLPSGSRYFWTVRSRFDLDGRTRVTEWSSTHFGVHENVSAPSRYSFRFRTP